MTVTEISTGVWRAGTRWVNWYLLDAGSEGCVVVDAGLPAYHRRLGRSLAAMGKKPSDVRAVVLTHGHIDHVGMAAHLADAGAPVHLHPDDAHLAANPRSNSPEKTGLPYLLYPATLGFVAHAIRNGALRPDRPVPATVPLTEGPQPELPGSPVVIHTPGHTDGSCVVEFPAHGVVFVGDLLCTASPITGTTVAPQLQTRASNHDSAQALASLDRVAGVQARLVLPGQGGAGEDGIEAAVASARRTGCR